MTLPLFDEPMTPKQSECLAELVQLEGWKADPVRDAGLMRDLTQLFPTVEIEREAVNYRIWLRDHNSKKRVNHHRRFTNWVKKSYEWGNERRSRSYRTHRQAEIEGHGEVVIAREQW